MNEKPAKSLADMLMKFAAAQPRTGDRIRLISTTDPWSKLQPGDEGTVSLVDSLGTVHVDWDNGSTLGLVPDEDRWEKTS